MIFYAVRTPRFCQSLPRPATPPKGFHGDNSNHNPKRKPRSKTFT